MKVLVNCCYGGFEFSGEFLQICSENGIKEPKRDDQKVIALMESLNHPVGGSYSNLQIAEIEDGLDYSISEYDGYESIETYLTVTKQELKAGLSKEKLDLLKHTTTIVVGKK